MISVNEHVFSGVLSFYISVPHHYTPVLAVEDITWFEQSFLNSFVYVVLTPMFLQECARVHAETTSNGTPSSCYKCGEEGHMARKCTSSAKVTGLSTVLGIWISDIVYWSWQSGLTG